MNRMVENSVTPDWTVMKRNRKVTKTLKRRFYSPKLSRVGERPQSYFRKWVTLELNWVNPNSGGDSFYFTLHTGTRYSDIYTFRHEIKQSTRRERRWRGKTPGPLVRSLLLQASSDTRSLDDFTEVSLPQSPSFKLMVTPYVVATRILRRGLVEEGKVSRGRR